MVGAMCSFEGLVKVIGSPKGTSGAACSSEGMLEAIDSSEDMLEAVESSEDKHEDSCFVSMHSCFVVDSSFLG